MSPLGELWIARSKRHAGPRTLWPWPYLGLLVFFLPWLYVAVPILGKTDGGLPLLIVVAVSVWGPFIASLEAFLVARISASRTKPWKVAFVLSGGVIVLAAAWSLWLVVWFHPFQGALGVVSLFPLIGLLGLCVEWVRLGSWLWKHLAQSAATRGEEARPRRKRHAGPRTLWPWPYLAILLLFIPWLYLVLVLAMETGGEGGLGLLFLVVALWWGPFILSMGAFPISRTFALRIPPHKAAFVWFGSVVVLAAAWYLWLVVFEFRFYDFNDWLGTLSVVPLFGLLGLFVEWIRLADWSRNHPGQSAAAQVAEAGPGRNFHAGPRTLWPWPYLGLLLLFMPWLYLVVPTIETMGDGACALLTLSTLLVWGPFLLSLAAYPASRIAVLRPRPWRAAFVLSSSVIVLAVAWSAWKLVLRSASGFSEEHPATNHEIAFAALTFLPLIGLLALCVEWFRLASWLRKRLQEPVEGVG
jgi:hypothetical protein